MPDETMKNVNSRLVDKLLKNPEWQNLRESLKVEVEHDYKMSLQKAIIDYVLKDSSELRRLKIGAIPRNFPLKIIRAPVPWCDSMNQAREGQSVQLFITNTVMIELQNLWHTK